MIQLCTAIAMTLATASWGVHATPQPAARVWNDPSLPTGIPNLVRMEVVLPPAQRHVASETPPYLLEIPSEFLD